MNQSKSSGKLLLPLFAAALMFAGMSRVAQAATSPARLSALIGETSAHFRLAFRMRPNEAQQRQEQLDAAVAAWRAAPRTAVNDEEFAKWLRSAIRASMPGQRDALPPIPDFKAGVRVEKRASEAVLTESPMSEPTSVSPVEIPRSDIPVAEAPTSEPAPTIAPVTSSDETTDPFRDDPIDETQQPVDLFGPWTEISK